MSESRASGGFTIHELPESERPRERLRNYGARALSNGELLAIVLRTGVGGESVLDLSRRILKRYDGLPGLARAAGAQLASERGLGWAKVAGLQAAFELGRRLVVAVPEERPQINSPRDAATLLMADMSLLEQEQLRTLLLDTKHHVVSSPTVYVGNVNTSVIRVAELFREAVRLNCVAMIVAHNHPSGDPTPSPDDVRVTEQIVKAGRLLDIEVLDHLILGHQRYVSMKERGLGFS